MVAPPVLSFSRSHQGGPLWGNKEMDKKRGLLLRAMPPITYEGSRIRPIASTYNVYLFLLVMRFPLHFSLYFIYGIVRAETGKNLFCRRGLVECFRYARR